MTETQLFTNNAVSLLVADLSPSDTSLTVMAGHGSLYPQPVNPGDFFLVTLENQTATAREIIKVTARSGDTFTIIERAQEGTTALAWSSSSGNDTLVDHRVTAETLRRAMSQPKLRVEQSSVLVGDATTLNFTGTGVSVAGTGDVKTITITAGSGGGADSIHGDATPTPIEIDPGWSIPISTTPYSEYQRGFKFFVTVIAPSNHQAMTFEVLGNITGNLGANAETVSWNRTARVGYNFAGSIAITIDVLTKQLNLKWLNSEAIPVEVLCTRIQHLP